MSIGSRVPAVAALAEARHSSGWAVRHAPEKRVLVIDDEPMIGTTLRVVLADDYDVAVVQSGTAARELLERDRAFDTLLCDLMMVDVSGMDLHAWLSERDPPLASRMIFMTGGAYTDRARSFLRRVDNPRIDKPFDTDELLKLIHDEEQRRDGRSSDRAL